MSPRYLFSRHAKNRMRHNEPKIAEAEVIAVVEKPDKTTPSEEGRTNAWKQRENDWLRVTYIVEQGATTIVTVTVTPRGPERRRRR